MNKALLLDDFIIAVNVFNESDSFIAGAKKSGKAFDQEIDILDYPFIQNLDQKSIHKKSFSIIYNNNKIGVIELFYTDYFTRQQTKSRTYNIFATYMTLMIALLFILYYFVSIKIINPISKLSNTLNFVADKKDYSVRVHTLFQDELGQLYKGFNFMLENIQQRDNNRDYMEKELIRIKNFLSNIIQCMPSILVTVDTEYHITQWNNAAENYFKIPSLQAIGKKLGDVVNVFNVFLDDFSENCQSKYYNRKHINENSILNIHIYPINNPELESIVILAEDITETEKKEEQLRQAQKMESIGNLAGGIAHDFNNILGGIIGTLSIINFNLSRKKEIPNDKLLEYLDLMEKSANRAADMVQQLLSLSRKQEFSMAPVDLNLTLKHVMKICKNSFDKSIEFVVNSSDDIALTMASPTHIEQVLLNLCINASHAMTIMRKKDQDQGGVISLSISRTLADDFFLQSHPEAEKNDYWKVQVGDTGVGMDSKTLSKIFEPFFTTKGKNVGTGLGLTMVYNIIKHHNGFIDVYSEPDIGTNIYIYLPVFKSEVNKLDAVKVETIKTGSGTILIADDEPFVRRIATEMLEMCGYNIILAEDGEETVNIYKQHKDEIKLIILDMVMPKKSGKEAFKEIIEFDPNAVVLLSSGFKQDERVENVLKSGAQAFIQKPYTLEKLSKMVDLLIKK
jgi:signal transduction histidine kinase/CheY-like chemotaxis protein/HAMP domain-containing protein